jgi:hypothetical protein
MTIASRGAKEGSLHDVGLQDAARLEEIRCGRQDKSITELYQRVQRTSATKVLLVSKDHSRAA